MSASEKSVSRKVVSVSMVIPWAVVICLVFLIETVVIVIPALRIRSTTVKPSMSSKPSARKMYTFLLIVEPPDSFSQLFTYSYCSLVIFREVFFVGKAHIFFPLSAAPCNASNTALRKPFFSRIRTPSMVVPAGEHTISFSSPGCIPVSRSSFALPSTAWAAN